jgi:hypothetical protein
VGSFFGRNAGFAQPIEAQIEKNAVYDHGGATTYGTGQSRTEIRILSDEYSH